jgi:hypothetical protein
VSGEDAVLWKTRGLDDWRWGADDRARLAIIQWYLEMHPPWRAGAPVILGSFHVPLAQELGYPFVSPNWFPGRTYACAAGPAKYVGALAQAGLPLDPARGHAGAEVGSVTDWSSLDLGSGARHPVLQFEARWRNPDLATSVDLEAPCGHGDDEFGDVTPVDGVPWPRGGGSPFLALSSRDKLPAHALVSLSVTHTLTARTALAFESVYGFQEGGDLAPLPFAIVRDAAMYGANLGVRHQLAPRRHSAMRAEWFRDEYAANLLWRAVRAGGGDVYALTANLAWEPLPRLLVRPEIKYDVYPAVAAYSRPTVRAPRAWMRSCSGS